MQRGQISLQICGTLSCSVDFLNVHIVFLQLELFEVRMFYPFIQHWMSICNVSDIKLGAGYTE